MRRLIGLFIIILISVGGCTSQEPLRIASKETAESRILAEMFVIMAGEANVPVKRNIPYGNTFDLQEAIKEGRIDLYPEYTGTGLSMMGMPSMSDGDKAMETVREIFSRFDLRWLDRLGFNNTFIMVMPSDTAAQMGVDSIGDLVGRTAELQLGCPEVFMARPVDGYPALIRRYGFSPEPEVMVTESREELYRELLTGRIDAAVVHSTDPQIEEFGLNVLRDNLDFFPVYQGAPLIREAALERYPGLREKLEKLAGLIDNETMRELNRRVMLDGFESRAVAENFLIKHDLFVKKTPELQHRELVLAVPPTDHRSTLLAKALDATRRVFPNRRVEVRSSISPIQDMTDGEAFLSLLGAESFYEVRSGDLPELLADIEAVAPVGFRMVHLIKRDNMVTPTPFGGVKKLGVGLEKGSSEQAAEIMLDAYEQADRIRMVNGGVEDLADQLLKGEIDGILTIASPGDAQMVKVLSENRLVLQPISGWDSLDRQYRYPFFRLARISSGIYPGLEVSVETVSSQVVLAGPKPDKPVFGDGDPVSGLRTQRQAIPRGVKQSLVNNLGVKETIDPTLPGERVTVVSARKDVQPINPAPGVSLITALFLAALGFFFYRLRSR